MNLHEYQAKQLLAQHGVEVPGGEPCTTADEARSIAEKLFADGHEMVVMKNQSHAGGRGKGVCKDGFTGGGHLCTTAG
ncbi:MAG: succinate--CoA ligase subunit beta, partial [Pedosphaera sp.]|nr:succinate--CoA ligase subunit beta [Pedosphaera sp.]